MILQQAMHQNNHIIKPEYQKAIHNVLHYINNNLSGDVSLETLADIANYSPFHFQKIFSSAVNESPKQYIMRLRLERAAHFLKVFPNLAVLEIGLECGFTSPSIFSRAFKKNYNVTAEEFRNTSTEEIDNLLNPLLENIKNPIFENTNQWIGKITNPLERIDDYIIDPTPSVNFFSPLKIACFQTTLSHSENITFAFKSLMQWAIPNDIITDNLKYIGILLDVPFFTSPEKCRYIAGIELKNDIKTNKAVNILNMKEGKYASFIMKGNLETTLYNLLALNHKYLDEMGYQVEDIICYEVYDECPAYKPYEKINKKILVPVKAKSN